MTLMRKGQSVGLIGAGKITDSPLERMWALRERLGPVKASSMRVASRIANSLRAGHPVVEVHSEYVPENKLVRVRVKQNQQSEAFQFPLTVALTALLGIFIDTYGGADYNTLNVYYRGRVLGGVSVSSGRSGLPKVPR